MLYSPYECQLWISILKKKDIWSGRVKLILAVEGFKANLTRIQRINHWVGSHSACPGRGRLVERVEEFWDAPVVALQAMSYTTDAYSQ